MKNCPKCNKEHSKPGTFCSKSCANRRAKSAETLAKLLEINAAKGLRENLVKFAQSKLICHPSIRKCLIHLYGNKCSICPQTNQWNGKPLKLIVDHIDGDASNCESSNFRLVCPNCNSQLDTFTGRNKGKGRKSLGLLK